MKKKISFIKSLFNNNPIFVSCLGMCPTLAVTTTLENAYLMGLSVLLVLVFTNFIISLIRKMVTEQIKIPVYIIIIATWVTVLELLMKHYLAPLYYAFGIYLPLIVVNCIILGRALSYAATHNVKQTLGDSFKTGLGFTIAISFLGLIRECLGNNTITIMDKTSILTGYLMKYNLLPSNNVIPNNFFLTPAGAFITLGIIMGLANAFRMKGE